MRMAIFDTHAVIKDLIGTGLPEKTAEAVVKAIKESKDNEISNLASKEQVALLEKDVENIMQHSATKADLAEVRTEIASLRTEIANVQTTMLKWYISSTFIIVSLLFAGFGTMLKLLKVF